ncbi:MAG: rhomboid family intramembrane serine protease, partial [Planctomycetota bacterium]
GRPLEERYGSREFLWFYLIAVVLGGLVWTLAELASPGSAQVLGASGAVVALIVLFAFNFPHQTILVMLLFPVPAWVFGCFVVVSDVLNATRVENAGQVAYAVHLAGAGFAVAYRQLQWRLVNFLPSGFKMPSFKRRPKLKVYNDDEDEDRRTRSQKAADDRLDELLRKVHASGIDSLTRAERKELERASRRSRDRSR